MGYLPEDQVAWLERALMSIGNPAVRDELTQLAEAAFATGYALGYRRSEAGARTELIRKMIAHLLDDIAAHPEPKTLIPVGIDGETTEPGAPAEPPTAKVRRAEFRTPGGDSALSILDQGWKPDAGGAARG